jgi:hypothetical protein
MVFFLWGTIRGNFAEKAYDYQMKYWKPILFRKFREKDFFIKVQKGIALFGLPFATLAYLSALWKFLAR